MSAITLNTLSLPGTRSQYLLSVDAQGDVVAAPVKAASPISGTGINVIQFSDTSIFALNASGSEIALLYEAALGREPDTTGLTTWINIWNSLPASVQAGGVYQSLAETAGGFNGSLSIADGFIQSAEFQTRYGALTDQAYITQLYANVLHRTPDQVGMDTWMTALTPVGQTYVDPTTGQAFAGQGHSRAYVLVGFAESTENITDCSATASTTSGQPGATSGTGGWLINTSSGGYLDNGAAALTGTESATSVLTTGSSSMVVDTSQINVTSINGHLGVGNLEVQPSAAGKYAIEILAIGNSAGGYTVDLSSAVNQAFVATNGNTIISPAGGGAFIQFQGSHDYVSGSVSLAGGNNFVAAFVGAGQVGLSNEAPSSSTITITGFSPASDSIGVPQIIQPVSFTGVHNPVSIISSGNGASLNFGANAYVLSLGNIGDGSLATVAALANKVYTVSDTNGTINVQTGAASWMGENLTIIGTTNAGNTEVIQWADFVNPTINGASVGDFTPVHSADVTGHGHIVAADLVQLFTLIGVQANQLTAADFH